MARISSPLTPQPMLPPDSTPLPHLHSTSIDLHFPALPNSHSVAFDITPPHRGANSLGSSNSSQSQSPYKETTRDSLSVIEAKYTKAVKELGRLQNEVSFLKGVMGTAGSDTNPRPIYLVPSELFYALKDILARCFAAIESNLMLLGQEGRELAQRYNMLKEKASVFLHSNVQITTELLMEMLDLLAAAEDVQRELTKISHAEVEKLSDEMSELLGESYKILMPIAAKATCPFEPNEMAIWNERRFALSKENASFSLISLKKSLLSDFEALKQRLLGQLLSIPEFQTVEKPHFRSSQKRPLSFPSASFSPSQVSEDMRFSLKRGLSDLFDALNTAKSEVGKWSWKDPPLKSGFAPRLEQTCDLDTAVRLARNEVEEITKVIVAEREEIEANIYGSVNSLKVRELETGVSSLIVENDILKAKLMESGTEIDTLKASLARLYNESHQHDDKNHSVSSPDKSSNSELLHENDLLHAEISDLKHALHRQTTELKAVISRVNVSCGLPVSTLIPDLERHILMLSEFYNENKEIELMESYESAMVLGYQEAKFLTTYGFNESNVSLGMKYLLDKTEAVMILLNEDYEGFTRNENTSMQDLQRKEYELLERIAMEVRKIKACKAPMEAEIGLLKLKSHNLADENKSLQQALKSLKDDRLAEESELFSKQKILETSISELNQEITHLNATVSHLRANLDITEIKIDFDLPQIEFAELQNSRLKTDVSVEERLVKGFELIIDRLLHIGVVFEEIPEGLLEMQKFVYEKLDVITEMLATERTRAAAAESATEAAKAETQQYWDFYTVQGQELASLKEQCAVLEQAAVVPDTTRSEVELKIQEFTDVAIASVTPRLDAVAERMSQMGVKLAQLVAGRKANTDLSPELDALRLKAAEMEEERTYLLEQLQVAEVVYAEASEENPVPFGGKCWERVSAILDELIRRTAAILTKEPSFPATISEKLRTLFDNCAEVPVKIDGDLQWYIGETVRLQAESASLTQQLGLTEVSIQLIDPPLEVLETVERPAVTEDNLAKGFDFSIQRIAETLQLECTPPTHLLEKQRYLHDFILQLSASYDQASLQLTAARQRISEFEQISVPEALVLDLKIDCEEASPPISSLRLYPQLFKGNEYLIAKAAHALEKVPFCPQTLLDQQMCLHDLLEKLCDIVRAVKEKKLSLKDAGDTYRAMYEDKGILEKLFWL